jgi:hypothetical protein
VIPITAQLANPPALGAKATTTVKRARTARSGSCCSTAQRRSATRGARRPRDPPAAMLASSYWPTLCYLNQMECFAPSANEPA